MDESENIQNFGRCPIGYNIAPSSDTGDNLSTNTIEVGEKIPLYWSNYHQEYVCKRCLLRVDDLIDDEKAHQDHIALEKRIQGMGFKQNPD